MTLQIETQGLTKQFDQFLAVDSVTLQVRSGQVLALLGPNGAGKTTTVRMLTSVLRPTRGWARVAGYDVVSQAPLVRAAVGVLTEQHGLYSRMIADDYLDFFGQLYKMDRAWRRRRLDSLLREFGLEPDRRRRIGEYSKGMRQKLALVRALLHEPPVLLLDEPTSAMDPESARLVRDALHQLRSAERTIVLCTHNLAEAEELADQIAIIRRGRIIAQGTVQELRERLLGPPEFDVVFSRALQAAPSDFQQFLPAGAQLTHLQPQGFRFRTPDPALHNPLLLNSLLAHDLPVYSLREAPRSLEQVYLQAIYASDGEALPGVG
jgi:ABC-2 type transport system ATP-binding protein